MSFVSVVPDELTAAAGDLAGLGSVISSANAVAAVPTTEVVPAAGDEVSAALAAVFSAHAQQFQVLSAQAASFHEQFVQTIQGDGLRYLEAEFANVQQYLATQFDSLQQHFLNVVNAPTNALFGRPLIGDGADGLAGTGANGGAGVF